MCKDNYDNGTFIHQPDLPPEVEAAFAGIIQSFGDEGRGLNVFSTMCGDRMRYFIGEPPLLGQAMTPFAEIHTLASMGELLSGEAQETDDDEEGDDWPYLGPDDRYDYD